MLTLQIDSTLDIGKGSSVSASLIYVLEFVQGLEMYSVLCT